MTTLLKKEKEKKYFFYDQDKFLKNDDSFDMENANPIGDLSDYTFYIEKLENGKYYLESMNTEKCLSGLNSFLNCGHFSEDSILFDFVLTVFTGQLYNEAGGKYFGIETQSFTSPKSANIYSFLNQENFLTS